MSTMIFIHLILVGILGVSSLSYGLYILLASLDRPIDKKDKQIFTLSLTAFILSIGLLCFGFWKLDNSDWVYSDTPYSTEKITALNDNNLTNGRMYLHRGYISEDLYYQYMVQLSNGGFKSNKVKAANATLFYADDDYRVEWYKKEKKWLWFEEEGTYNKIYIPEGSISEDYSIDLE